MRIDGSSSKANMKYGRQGFKMKGLDLKEILRMKLVAGELC